MSRKPIFDRTEHQIAAIAGWLIFAIGTASLWSTLWVVAGMAILWIALNTSTSESGRYGFIVWIGFWSAWPYVLYARSAWRKPDEAEVEQVVEAAIRKAQS